MSACRRAYIVDDDDAFRRSLVVLLQSAGWETAEFASAGAFNESSGDLEPGMLLLDLHMNGGTGLELLESASSDLDRFAVVMITGAGDVATAVRSMKAGAVDFVEKPFAPTELLGLLDRIHADFAAGLADKAAQHDARQRVARLSNRERDVLERLLAGMPNKMIARDIDISPRTVEMHRARMLHKLSATTTAEALELGRLAGLKPVAPAEPEKGPPAN